MIRRRKERERKGKAAKTKAKVAAATTVTCCTRSQSFFACSGLSSSSLLFFLGESKQCKQSCKCYTEETRSADITNLTSTCRLTVCGGHSPANVKLDATHSLTQSVILSLSCLLSGMHFLLFQLIVITSVVFLFGADEGKGATAAAAVVVLFLWWRIITLHCRCCCCCCFVCCN